MTAHTCGLRSVSDLGRRTVTELSAVHSPTTVYRVLCLIVNDCPFQRACYRDRTGRGASKITTFHAALLECMLYSTRGKNPKTVISPSLMENDATAFSV